MKNDLRMIPNSIESQLTELALVRLDIEQAKKHEEKLKESIIEHYKFQMDSKYKEKGESFGVINIQEENFKLSINIPKKVKWNQEGLKKLYADGAPVDIEFSVSEKTFKAQDDAGKATFMPHRTVEPGKVTIEIKYND